jgi:hypothetical protein
LRLMTQPIEDQSALRAAVQATVAVAGLLHPAFVPFIEQTARYLAGSERQGGAQPVDAYLDLRNAKEQTNASRSPTRKGSGRSPWAKPPPPNRSGSPKRAITICAWPMDARTKLGSTPIPRNPILT